MASEGAAASDVSRLLQLFGQGIQALPVGVDAVEDGRVVATEEACDFAKAVVMLGIVAQLPPQFLASSDHRLGAPAATELLGRDPSTAADAVEMVEQVAHAKRVDDVARHRWGSFLGLRLRDLRRSVASSSDSRSR